MNITTVGRDLAKRVFQVPGVDERGKVRLRQQLRRREVLSFFATLPPCLIGREACDGAHYGAQRLREYGHRVKLMAPQFVRP
jgi:transposase